MKDQFGEKQQNTGKIKEGEVTCWLYLVVRHAANKRLSDLIELAKENIPEPAAKAPSASLTPLRCCKTSTDDAALCAQQKRGKLALT